MNWMNANFNREKIEQIDNDITYVLRKDKKEVEGPIIETQKSAWKRKLGSLIACWKAIVSEKDGKYVSKGVLQKRVHMDEIRFKQHVTS